MGIPVYMYRHIYTYISWNLYLYPGPKGVLFRILTAILYIEGGMLFWHFTVLDVFGFIRINYSSPAFAVYPDTSRSIESTGIDLLQSVVQV